MYDDPIHIVSGRMSIAFDKHSSEEEDQAIDTASHPLRFTGTTVMSLSPLREASSGPEENVTSGDDVHTVDIHSMEAMPKASNTKVFDLSPPDLPEAPLRHLSYDSPRQRPGGQSRSSAGRFRCSSSSTTNVSTGSPWARLLVLTLCFLSLVDYSQARPVTEENEVDRHYRELEMRTVKYLAQFGYLQGPTRETQSLKTRDELVRAIKQLQKAGGIPQTGVIGRQTAELIAKPRCGNTDDFASENEDKGYGPFHHRSKRYTLSTSKWPNTTLTFRFINYTPDMPKTETRKIISDALRVWSDETPLSFTEVPHSHADIMIQFASNYHSDGYPFDGRGMVLAHAFFPSSGRGGDTHFDDDEEWNPQSPHSMDLFMVAAHEFGHALGLAHSGDPSALMYPWYMGVDGKFKLPEDDKRGITSLYGTGEKERHLPDRDKVVMIPNSKIPVDREPTYDVVTRAPQKKEPDTIPDPCRSHIDALTVIRTEIFIFIGEWCWRLDSRKLITKPIKISHFWYGLPKDVGKIDAVYERLDGKIVFFSGDKYWIFNANQIIRGFPTEGRPITEYNIPADVKQIDAAFVWGYNLRTYLVSGDMYWKMNENNTFVEYDYPRDMGTWKNVPVPLDAAFKDQTGKTYFFQKYKYWEFYDMKMEVRPNYPKRIDLNWLSCPQKNNDRDEEAGEYRQGADKNLADQENTTKRKGENSANRESAQTDDQDGDAAMEISSSKTLIMWALLAYFYHYIMFALRG